MWEFARYVLFAFLSLQVMALGALVYESLFQKSKVKNHGYRGDYGESL
jgi:hypothetical protein